MSCLDCAALQTIRRCSVTQKTRCWQRQHYLALVQGTLCLTMPEHVKITILIIASSLINFLDLEDLDDLVKIFSDGTMFWGFPKVVESLCPLNVEFFPWDTQVCVLKFGSWTYNMSQVSDVIMGPMTCQIAGVSIVCPTVCSAADRRKHQSSASLAFVRGIHW